MDNMGKRILIVEDELISAEYLKELLLKENYTIVGIVNSGEEAILQAKVEKPDLILMDIMLEGSMSGCEAAVQIHQHDKDIKFICLTAYAEDEMIEYAIEADVRAYLLKPYRENEILATIKLIFAHEELVVVEVDNENIALIDGYSFNIKKHRLFKENSEVSLGNKAVRLIEILAKNRNVSVSNEQISTYIWGESKNDRTLRSLIHRVRRLINSDLIQNINGLGYKIV
jgi:DNA-binding response OmpR family regulator